MGRKAGLAVIQTPDGFRPAVVDVSAAGDTEVHTGPGVLAGAYINTAPDAAVEVKDGENTLFVIPANAAAGTTLDFLGAEFLTSLVITADVAAAAGSIVVVYNPYTD